MTGFVRLPKHRQLSWLVWHIRINLCYDILTVSYEFAISKWHLLADTHTHTHIYFQSANHSSPFLLRISIHSQILSHVCIIFLLFIRHTPPPTHQTCLMCCCCSIACHSNHFAQSSHFTRFWFLALPLRCVFIFGPLLILLPVCVIWMWGKCDSRSAEQRWLLVI